jgi:hypothetical protein
MTPSHRSHHPDLKSRRFWSKKGIIRDLERRAVLRPGLAVIVHARGGDVRMPQPLLHLGDIGLVVERVGVQAQAVLAAAEADPDAFLETHPRGSFRETRFRETVLRDC